MYNALACFLQYDCDVDVQDGDQWTALWHAYATCSEHLLERLLTAGADPRIPNAEGITVLEDARQNEDDDMIEILKKY